MRLTSKDLNRLTVGQEYWVAWHHCYSIYKTTYLGIHPINDKYMFEVRSYLEIKTFSDKDVDFFYLCSTEIEARRAMIQEIEKNLNESKSYLQKLIDNQEKPIT